MWAEKCCFNTNNSKFQIAYDSSQYNTSAVSDGGLDTEATVNKN